MIYLDMKRVTVLFILVSSTASSHFNYYTEYDDGFVDFTDMGSYNHGFQKNLNIGKNGLKPPGVVEEENIKVTRYNYDKRDGFVEEEETHYSEGAVSTKLRSDGLAELELSIKSVEVIETTKKYKTDGDSVAVADDTASMKFLKRIVASLMRQMNVRGHVFGPGEAITIDLQAEISHSDFMVLNKFVGAGIEPEKYLTQVDSILSNMLHVVAPPVTPELFETIKEGMLNIFGVFFTPKNLLLFSVMFVFLLLVTLVLWRTRNASTIYHAMIYGFLTLFLISCVWTFVSMFEAAKVENYSRVMQSESVPRDCEFDRLEWWDSIKYFFRVHLFQYEDRCIAYHRAVMVDPIWNISPTEAISQTFAKLVFSPAGYIGGKVGEFFNNATNVFPFWLRPLVLILLFVFVFIGVFRFKIKTPFLSIEPCAFSDSDRNNEGNKMLPEAEAQNQQQIAENPAREMVEIKTRDACVDTSDFEEYLRSRSSRRGSESGGPTPELLPPQKVSFFQLLSSRSSLIFVVLSGVLDVIILVLDKTLRQVPFVSEEDNNGPLEMDLMLG